MGTIETLCTQKSNAAAHKFHRACLLEFFRNKQRENCPLCRRQIFRSDYFPNEPFQQQQVIIDFGNQQQNNLNQPLVNGAGRCCCPWFSRESCPCCSYPFCSCCYPCCSHHASCCLYYFALSLGHVGYIAGLVYAFFILNRTKEIFLPIYSLVFYTFGLVIGIDKDCWVCRYTI